MTLDADLDRIAAESSRRSAAVIDELTSANARTAIVATDLATRSARAIEALQRRQPPAEPRQEALPDVVSTPGAPGWPVPEHPDSSPAPDPSFAPGAAPERTGRHAAPDPDENTRPLRRAPVPADADREELQERRDAIARSIAARRAQSVARPSDQDDEEGEYYRRTSWLI
ncbi:hypothetical protein [Nocardia asteroides]|uniref:hypothetical protein n=1 Tax=Nocardia asteroides TaxID=1824 RepID=UPI001E4C48A3|nr:hypothetical protein [Nocardia asteroides]UGT60049.1 hypothetical protein LTT61_22915 [Nocardia asteroides]